LGGHIGINQSGWSLDLFHKSLKLVLESSGVVLELVLELASLLLVEGKFALDGIIPVLDVLEIGVDGIFEVLDDGGPGGVVSSLEDWQTGWRFGDSDVLTDVLNGIVVLRQNIFGLSGESLDGLFDSLLLGLEDWSLRSLEVLEFLLGGLEIFDDLVELALKSNFLGLLGWSKDTVGRSVTQEGSDDECRSAHDL
jgi:hypothetical protein